MPLYEYRCTDCHATATLRRAIAEMDAPAACGECGGTAERQFSPTNNLHVPINFQAKYGSPTWSDFFDVSERELAHMKDEDGRAIEITPANRALSQPGAARSKQSRAEDRKREVSAAVEAAVKEAKALEAAHG